jgi:pimeloyl-ACP methyl ester carboxylesterase/DNA-binding CsgD family transcriptional regulator
MGQQIRFCTAADGVRIAYAVTGDGPPLVKAANWLSHLEFDWTSPVWNHWLTELSRHNTLIRYDERGNGLSDRHVDDLSFEAWVQDLEAVVDTRGLAQFDLFGVSQGGAVAVAYAARHPERVKRIVLYGAYARGWRMRDVTPQQAQEAETLVQLMKLGWGSSNPAFRQVFANVMMPEATQEQQRWFTDLQHASTSAEIAVRLREIAYGIDVTALAPLVRAPALILHARGDVAIPIRESQLLAELIPNARLVSLDSRNHVLIEDEPAWPHFLSELRSFLGTSTAESGVKRPTAVFPELTARERALLELLARGMNNADIATRLYLSPKTVRNRITSIFDKLNVHTRGQAIVLARDAGFGQEPATHSSTSRP